MATSHSVKASSHKIRLLDEKYCTLILSSFPISAKVTLKLVWQPRQFIIRQLCKITVTTMEMMALMAK
jgi:hypothetical protein